MKKKFLLLMGIFSLGILNAQVGINTRTPQGIFHIDARGDTNGNLNIDDDVVVTKSGNVGIGTVTPQRKMEIVSTTPGAIRIADTSQGALQPLTSDENGLAKWNGTLIGTWYAYLSGGNLPYTAALSSRPINFTGGVVSKPGVGSVNPPNGKIIVPYTGFYRLTVFGTSLMNRATGFFICGYFIIYQNGSMAWGPHSLGNTLLSSSPYVSYYTCLALNSNDVLNIVNMEVGSGYANAVSNLTFFIEYLK